jgi:hypothetical protein
LLEQFARIEELEWTVCPQVPGEGGPAQLSVVTVGGMIGTSRVCLRVRSSAPEAIGPGLREFPDGRVESV